MPEAGNRIRKCSIVLVAIPVILLIVAMILPWVDLPNQLLLILAAMAILEPGRSSNVPDSPNTDHRYKEGQPCVLPCIRLHI